MPEFERSQRINAAPDAVYAFVSDVGNLPQYLPTTKAAQPQGGERVRVQAEARGHQYDDDGFFRADPVGRRLEWGADERDYRGWLQIVDADGASDVTVHLAFSNDLPQRIARETGDAPPNGPPLIEEGIDAALQSIRNIAEGQGGKVEPSTAT